jgi:hypothetical protein
MAAASIPDYRGCPIPVPTPMGWLPDLPPGSGPWFPIAGGKMIPTSLLPRAGGKPCPGAALAPVFRGTGGVQKLARTRIFPGISPDSGPWWLSPWGRGPGKGFPPPRAKRYPESPLCKPLPPPGGGARAVMAISSGKPCPGAPLPSVSRRGRGRTSPGPSLFPVSSHIAPIGAGRGGPRACPRCGLPESGKNDRYSPFEGTGR